MPEENSIFMKTSSRALGILTQLHSETAQAMYAYTVGRQQEANEMALSNAILAERLIGCYRVIPSLLGSPHARKNIEHIMQDEIPVEVGFTEDGWFSLRIPRLLPRKERGKGSVEYIRGFLGPALQRFFKEESPVRFDNCVIIYRHIYDREEPERRHRDHDNIETNFVTDIVALYVMSDDAPLRCRHYYCSAAGSTERTEVYVVPEQDFMRWYEAEKNFPDEGVKLHAQTTFWQEKAIPKQG